MRGLLIDPRLHLAGLALAVALGAGTIAEAFPADPIAHGGWWCCKDCSRRSPPPPPIRWLTAAWSTTTGEA